MLRNVAAVALVAALLAAATAGAQAVIDGGDVRNNSLTGKDVKDKGLTKKDFKARKGRLERRGQPERPTSSCDQDRRGRISRSRRATRVSVLSEAEVRRSTASCGTASRPRTSARPRQAGLLRQTTVTVTT